MRAFESSPVHCLNFLPSGKRLSPAKGGASAILYNRLSKRNDVYAEANLPPVNVIEYLLCFWFWVFSIYIVIYPRNKVVFERAFD